MEAICKMEEQHENLANCFDYSGQWYLRFNDLTLIGVTDTTTDKIHWDHIHIGKWVTNEAGQMVC